VATILSTNRRSRSRILITRRPLPLPLRRCLTLRPEARHMAYPEDTRTHTCRAVQREAMSQSCMKRGTWDQHSRQFLNFELRALSYPPLAILLQITGRCARKCAAAQYFSRGPGADGVAHLPSPLMHARRTPSHARGTNNTSEIRKRSSSPCQAHAALVHARAPN
jgi:hypothetical protein